MSYQFTFRAATVADAMAEARRRIDAETASQPEHLRDQQILLDHLQAMMHLFESQVTENHELLVSVNSSVTGTMQDGQLTFVQTAGNGVSIGLLALAPTA